MATGVRTFRDNWLSPFLRQLPLAGVAGLSVFAFAADLLGLLDRFDWFKQKLPSMTFLAAGAIALYLSIEQFSVRRDMVDLKQLISEGEGFRRVPVTEISKIAARMMPDVETVRTLGTARQDLLEVDESARLYLRATERRVRRSSPFSYYRITSEQLRDAFIGHLILLLSAADARHDIQVQLIPNIETTVTYQIFDTDHVLVILDNPQVPGGRRDYTIALISSDKEIVNAFTVHFDAAWSRQTPIADPQEFKKKVVRIT